MATVTNWNKFTLLLWKNWTLKWHRKWELAIELVLPAIFASLLVIMRTLLTPKPNVAETKYLPVNISNLDLYVNSLGVENLLKPPRAKFLYSPNTSAVFDRIIEAASSSLSIQEYQGYANVEDLEYALKTDNYLVGVQFNNVEDYPKKLSYALRFPSALRTANIPETWLTTRLFPEIITSCPRNHDQNDGGIPVGYIREGFIPIQHAISMAYIKLASNQESMPIIEMQRYPYPPYIYDVLMDILSRFMGPLILMSFLYSCIVITKNISSEKDTQLKEVMKMMGLQSWIHWTAWFIQSFFMLGISSLLIMIIVRIKWSKDMAVFTYADCTCLFFFLLVYSVTIICFCFMVACFFSKASTAAAVTGLIAVCTFLPFDMMVPFYDNLSLAQKLGWCLLFNTAMPLGLKVMIEYERTREGLHWFNMFTPVSVDDSLTLGAIILVMLASCVPFLLICLYIEQINPGEFGVARKWNFPFTAQFWRCNTKYKGVEDTPNVEVQPHNHDAFEVEPTGKRVCVQVKSLEKKFDDKIAVKGISLNMYEDEITVLLGHNGAGKTTTLSMLAGMFPPTSGTAIIEGSDIRTNLEAARMSLGFCPEHNVLFDDLSVSNHITFFSCVKGLKGEALQKEVDTYLKMIKLEHKANVAASKLSGGMKRKLSLCCALCGNTKVVLCDEPSSGMDPSSRRQLWDLFQSKKIGRTVLITTHYMDEADVLGDRIAIMFKGELKCHGSSFFLKKKYGAGYNLNCVKLEGCNANEVSAVLGDFIPGIKPKSDIGAELSYELPDKYSSVFEKMFRSLEKNSERLKLNGYGISITSLEEVFMKVGAESAKDATHKEQNAKINGNSKFPEEDLESIQSKRSFSASSRLLRGADLFFNQWHAMFLKKFLYTFRNKILFLMQNIFPIAFVIIIISKDRFTEDKDLPPMTMELTQYPDVVTILEQDPSLNYLARDAVEVKIADYYKEIANTGPDHTFKSTGSSSFTDYVLYLGKTLQLRIDSTYLAAATVAEGKITAWLNNQPLHTAPLTINLVHNAMAKALIDPNAEITITNAPLPLSTESILNKLSGDILGIELGNGLTYAMCFVTAFYVLILIKERDSRWNLIQFVGGAKVWIFWITQLIWDMTTFSITALAVIITIYCFQPKCFTEFDQLARYFLILILFGFSILPFTYLFSFFFTQPGTGFACVSIINLLLGNGMAILLSILSVQAIGDDLPWYFRVFPLFSLKSGWCNLYINTATNEACNDALATMGSKEILCKITPKCCNPIPYFDWKEPGVLPEIVYFITTGIIFFLIVIIIEYGSIKKMANKLCPSKIKQKSHPEGHDMDEDVYNEQQRILAMSNDELAEENLVLDRVSKYYKNFLAVNEVSLCIKHGECFGLLGVNGAGKTTLFKMIIGDENISSGSVYFKGLTLDKNKRKIYREIGYCPQFDALLDDLTGREILNIYCLLRGIHRKNIKQVCEDLGNSFGFMDDMDKKIKFYSGGSKRKLSMALAVIGSPLIIFLDEPTTAMDPASRRQLWNMIILLRNSGTSIVLVSHSMEECEALCTRLVIMVNGELKCIGSTQHLKNKFSKGLILKIKVKPSTDLKRRVSKYKDVDNAKPVQANEEDINNIKKFVEREFVGAILQEEYQGILTFYIPLNSIKWSKIFGLMERNRKQLNIEDYSISQTTLEEIFLDFATQSKEPRATKDQPIPVSYTDGDTDTDDQPVKKTETDADVQPNSKTDTGAVVDADAVADSVADADAETFVDTIDDSDTTYADAASETDTYTDADP